MKHLLLLTAALVAALLLAACGDDDAASPTPTATASGNGLFFDCAADHPASEPDTSGFPVTVTDGAGTEVTISKLPRRIISLDAAHTETLYALGAGDQVVAVDKFSDCPVQVATLSARIDAYSPSLEAITGLEPDLVITAFDSADIVAAMRGAGLTVLLLPTPADVAGAYDDIGIVGEATGHGDQADEVINDMETAINDITGSLTSEAGPTVYHEVDNTYFSVGPGSFINDLYDLLGAENIAAPTGKAFPQLSAETIIAANPEVIVLADEAAGETAQTVAARPGWGVIDAVKNGRIVGADPDLLSRASPRIVDAMRALKAALYPES